MRGVEVLQNFAAAQGVPEKIISGWRLAFGECRQQHRNHALQRDAQRRFKRRWSAPAMFRHGLSDDGPAF